MHWHPTVQKYSPGLLEEPVHHEVIRAEIALLDACQNGTVLVVRIEEAIRREGALLVKACLPLRQRGMYLYGGRRECMIFVS